MNRILKPFSLILSLLVAFSLYTFSIAAPAVENLPFEAKAKSVMLLDANSGNIIYQNNPDTSLPVASVTKMMSMLLFFESLDNDLYSLSDKLTVSEKAAGMGGTQAFLEKDAKYPAEILLESVIVASANDSTIALAEKIAGSEEAFVSKMNTKAKEMGLTGTNFVNATGLSAPGQQTTAQDLSKIAMELAKVKKYFSYSNIWMDNIKHGADRFTDITNTNRLIRFYAGCDGFATGSDKEAGYCGVYTATKGNFRLIAIVLGADNSSSRNDLAAKLLDYGFANFAAKKIYKKGDIVKKNVPVKNGELDKFNLIAEDSLNLLLEREKEKEVKKEIILQEEYTAPITKGEKLGEAVITLDGKEIGRVNLIAQEDVETSTVMRKFNRILVHWLMG